MLKTSKVSVLLIALVAVGCFSCGVQAVNLIGNGGFEDGNTDWYVTGGNWDTSPSAAAHSGVKGARRWGAWDAELVYDPCVMLRPNETYYASLWSTATWEIGNGAYADRLRVNGTDVVAVVHTGSWANANAYFNVGNVDSARISIGGFGSDVRHYDDVELIGDNNWYKRGSYNGNIDGLGGWKLEESAAYFGSVDHSGDGSGSIGMYKEGASDYGVVSQWMLVDPNTDCTLSWYSSAVVADVVHRFDILDENGVAIYSSGDVFSANGWQWVEHTHDFNTGPRDMIYVRFRAIRIDRVNLDDITITPHHLHSCEDVKRLGYIMPGDQNEDCMINLIDFTYFINDWLSCNNPDDPACDLW